MPKFALDDMDSFGGLIKTINEVSGDADKAAELAMKEVFEVITPMAADAVKKPNLPRGGKYSSGATERSLKKTPKISWDDNYTVYVDVGFSVKKGGLPSLFMIYGKPTYMKNTALYEAFYGDRTKNEVQKTIANALFSWLDEKMLGWRP